MFRIFLVAMVFSILPLGACHSEHSEVATKDVVGRDGLSITVTVKGYVYQWRLHVEPTGEAQVSEIQPERKEEKFKIQRNQFQELKQALTTEHFFELGDEYGEVVPDGEITELKVTEGNKTKSVCLLYLKNWEREGNSKLAEAKRAEHILSIITKWKKLGSQEPTRAQTMTGR